MPEEEELQMKPTLQRVGQEGGAVAGDFEAALQGAKGGGQALDPSLQAQMGQAMRADFSGVKVHTDAQSDQLNQSIQAKAFTTGQDVFFRQGAYEPGSRGGQELIAHELTHVVQQDRRLGQRMSQDSNDLMGATAVNTSSQNISHNQLGSITNSEVVQGYFLGAANNSVSHTVSEGQDRQADNSFRDPLDPTHTALATSGSDPTAANSLKISEDGKLAIENTNGDRQAKIFFAQSGVIDSSNKILLKKGSKYILQVATASAITVTDAKGKVHTLDAIEPVLNPDAGKKSTSKKVAPSLGGQKHGNAVQVEATCIAVAEAIMNKKYGNTATLNVKIKKLGALTTTDAIQWAAIVADAMTKNGKRKNGAINQDVIAQAYGVFVNQHPVAAAKIAKKLGVNEFASPKVGESYISESVGNPGATGITNWLLDDTGATDTDLLANDATVRGGRKRTGWGNHAGAVVATSAGNNITMENYARSGEDSTLKDSDNIFYFAMYGPASKPTQTWHAVWSGGATPIANAVTGVLK